jgi:hypothetical protein
LPSGQEDAGVIADHRIGNSQLDYLQAALGRMKSEGFKGAVIVAHHHPAYAAGSQHGWSEQMLSQIDAACLASGLWPPLATCRAVRPRAELPPLHPPSWTSAGPLHHLW